MFETASRLKLRFSSAVGLISVEDLWDLPLTSTNRANLDAIAIALDAELKATSGVSFVSPSSKDTKELQLKFDIVKHIIDRKIAENAAKVLAKSKAQQVAKIKDLIAEKEDEALKNLSADELKALLKESE